MTSDPTLRCVFCSDETQAGPCFGATRCMAQSDPTRKCMGVIVSGAQAGTRTCSRNAYPGSPYCQMHRPGGRHVESRVIVAPGDRERTAIVSIALPAGAEVPIDPTWRFLGWRDEMKVTVDHEPRRITIEGDTHDL